MSPKNEFGQEIGFEVLNWEGAKFPEKITIHGNFCILEPLEKRHAKALFDAFSIRNQGESWTYLPYGPFAAIADFEQWIDKIEAEADTQLYAILDKTTQQPLGISGYLRINPQLGSIEVGHLHYSKLLQRTAIATECMFLLMRYAFDDLNYRRYEWKCDELNIPSVNAAQRLGFSYEGTFRQSMVYKNRNRNTAWFSIIDKEWPDLKNKFSRWLDLSNFDENGQQKISLQNI